MGQCMRLGIDTGGTFTDFVLLDETPDGPRLRTHKVLSTPDAPERAILQGIAELGLGTALAAGQVALVHGSTVATNAALEGKGVRTAFVTNRGFADLLSIGRQTRPWLYRLEQPPAHPPVPAELCLETGGRLSAQGELLESLEEADLDQLVTELHRLAPEAVAICLLFSFLDPTVEARLAHHLGAKLGPAVFICHSAEVLRESREYERGIATWLNASLGPLMSRYLLQLGAATRPCPLAVLQSNGGTIDATAAARGAVNLLLSGPAGGLAAVDWLARQTGIGKLMTFDMGGTSTDVALYDGGLSLSSEGSIGPWPVAVPMVDMHTIGAGGGSIAWRDAGGLLQVGPGSAGAKPGPACYDRGGTLPTVTDANVLLGRLPAELALGADIQLNPQAATKAIGRLAEQSGLTDTKLASGILAVANEHMAQALRVISVARGHDPREFTLCCFGGAGGLHVCALAEALGMSRALVPMHAGVLSALGMLVAPARRDLSRSWQGLLDQIEPAAIDSALAQLAAAGKLELLAEGHAVETIECQFAADLRYRGQSACLTLPWQGPAQTGQDFTLLHATRYGHSLHAPVELVCLRASLSVRRPPLDMSAPPVSAQGLQPIQQVPIFGFDTPVPVYRREQLAALARLTGPALIIEAGATTLLTADWEAFVDGMGNLQLNRT